MKQERRTEITKETIETTIIRFRDSREFRYCETCHETSVHLTEVQAEQAFSLSESLIAEMIGSGRLHIYHSLICANSISDFETKEQTENK